MNDVVISILIYASIVAVTTRMSVYAFDPSKITRLDNGKIHWVWCSFNNITRGAMAVGASLAVWFIVLPYFQNVTEEWKVAVASLSAIAGESIWLLIGHKIKIFVDKFLSDDVAESKRRGKR